MASLHEGTPILEVRGLTKGFPNGTLALRGVDLRVTQGSVHGLVGANGGRQVDADQVCQWGSGGVVRLDRLAR